MSCRVHVHFVIGSFFLRLPIMQHILPLLSFDTRIEIEKWKLLNKFRAAVSVLRTSFDFSYCYFLKKCDHLIEFFIKRVGVVSHFCGENIHIWITLSQKGDDSHDWNTKHPEQSRVSFQKTILSLYIWEL